MKTIDVRISCNDGYNITAESILATFDYIYTEEAGITVTELQPQGEQPAAPVAAPNCNLCKPPIDKENCAACNGIPAPVAPDEFNCHDCARVSDCGHFGYPENEKCFVQPAAPVAPAVDKVVESPKNGTYFEPLLNCPFCGKKAVINNEDCSVDCSGCTASTFAQDFVEQAIQQWNERQPAPCPSCEKLRAENARLNGIIERATEITPLNCKELLKTLDEVKSALNQPKEDK